MCFLFVTEKFEFSRECVVFAGSPADGGRAFAWGSRGICGVPALYGRGMRGICGVAGLRGTSVPTSVRE